MKISKIDAIEWLKFLSDLPEDKEWILTKYEEIVLSIFSQIEKVVEGENNKLISQIKSFNILNGQTYFVGDKKKFPKGCMSCLMETGINPIRKSNKCNLKCKFCYHYGNLENQKPIPDDVWEIGGTKFYEEDIEHLLSVYKRPYGVAYVYLEPFIEIEKYYSIIKKMNFAGIYQHIYTNGTLVTENKLKLLGEMGLDEIRFNLGASNCSEEVIEMIKIAKKYIKYVGIETPMTPEFFKEFLKNREKILNTNLDFINCAELHLNDFNLVNYKDEKVYISRYGYISPIWSRELTIKLMKIASEENWNVVVHDCSNRTKFFRDLNFNSKLNMWFGANSYGIEFKKIPFKNFMLTLLDENFIFLEEEELPIALKVNNIVNI
ncbi:radical SAM protein [Cetobacterium sp.]|uniref:radical SAM protein n=1 Tax=Cetobacterium sp. TaxID=2071632 RepID=UPI003F31C94D